MRGKTPEILALWDAGNMIQSDIARAVGVSPVAVHKAIKLHRGGPGVCSRQISVRGDALLHVYSRARAMGVKPEDVVNEIILAAMQEHARSGN